MKTNILSKGSFILLTLLIISLLVSEGGVTKEKPEAQIDVDETQKNIIYTTTDLRCEYEIIGVVTHYQQFGRFGFKDPLEGALKKGMEKFEESVKEAGGDAVVGLRYNFANRTQKDEGRLLIYGTVVKLK